VDESSESDVLVFGGADDYVVVAVVVAVAAGGVNGDDWG